MNYEKQLNVAIEAALEAGDLLRAEFHRPGGPRGQRAHADADEEAEWKIRKRLLDAFPEYRYRGEETGSTETNSSHVWLVDPNDGTTSFLRGERGSAVSIGLIRDGIPILGVIYAFAAPDDLGDLISWAEECPFTRNGRNVNTKWLEEPAEEVVILVSGHREHLIEPALKCVIPFRCRDTASIAYRLALVAVGEASAAVSWHSPGDWDYAAGHALIRAAGGRLINEDGMEISYAPDGASKVKMCFGGSELIVRELVKRDWQEIRSVPWSEPAFRFARPEPGIAMKDASVLSRAQGCLLGQVAGDALGQLVEFMDADSIHELYPQGVRMLRNGGAWNTLAGQPTDDSEMTLLLARSIIQEKRYHSESVARSYYNWYRHMQPFDVGNTISQALRSIHEEDVLAGRAAETMALHASTWSQANGSLMRISPLGIYGHRKKEEELWKIARVESCLTHPHSVCQDACALFTAVLSYAIRTGNGPDETYRYAIDVAERQGIDAELRKVLDLASRNAPRELEHSGWVLIAFQNAFYQLLHSTEIEAALVQTIGMGGDTDTNAAIAGAILGAVHGRAAIPLQWQQMVLSCRPHSVTGAHHPRPFPLWPIDLLPLAELLLLAGLP